jgi:hypothetical protein
MTAVWRKSTRSSSGNCVEVADAGDVVLVRDSKNTGQPALGFDRAAWAAFVAGIRAGDFHRR